MKKGIHLIFLLSLILTACSEEKVPERFYPRSDHEAYWYNLKQANLLQTALGKEWQDAAKRPFEEQIEVLLPYNEAFRIDDKTPDALGYRFDVKRGQKVLADISLISSDSAHLFIDLFRIENDSLGGYIHVASADSSFSLGFEPRRNASYLLRIQPELLRGGYFTLLIQKVASLEFPVAGRNKRAIGSFFGDPREGGRREHHGVDIFAPRHTPIVAPTKGYVRFVGTRGIGGKVVWLYDQSRGQNLYFAHLEDQLVEPYSYVNIGDTLGTVGNSGNARTTPTHLHFGIYSNGPIDPYYFIVDETKSLLIDPIDTSMLGDKLLLNRSILVHTSMSENSNYLDTLRADEEIDVSALNHQFARVTLKHGKKGFIPLDQLSRSASQK